MPYYDHDKDYPFAAFITNLGKYNEGELVGEWVKFPTTAEELKEVFKRIGIGQKDDFGQPYEEWFITDYDCYVDGLYSKLGEYENLDELNYLASKLDEMSESEYAQFQAGMEMGDHCGTLRWRKTAPSRIRAMCVIRVTVSMSITTVSAAVSPTNTG